MPAHNSNRCSNSSARDREKVCVGPALFKARKRFVLALDSSSIAVLMFVPCSGSERGYCWSREKFVSVSVVVASRFSGYPLLTLAPASVILKALRTTSSGVMLGFRARNERFQMYLTALDLLAVMIALVVSVTLVITTAVANARLQRKIDQLRTQRWEITKEYESIISDLEQK
jgi:hypothetical protein